MSDPRTQARGFFDGTTLLPGSPKTRRGASTSCSAARVKSPRSMSRRRGSPNAARSARIRGASRSIERPIPCSSRAPKGSSSLAPVRSAADAAAVRGKALFESQAVGCATCHAGERLSNNATVDIGKADIPTQTPSLVGVAYRAPFMHDGCAATLRDRFEPECGGTKHGDVAHLDAAALDDLVAYLESL